MLPPPAWQPKGKPYKSRWKMTAEEAAVLNAIEPIVNTRELLDVPETPLEVQQRVFLNTTSSWLDAKRPEVQQR